MSYISAGNSTTTTIKIGGDTTGNLVFATGGANTTALTLTNAQVANFVNTPQVNGTALQTAKAWAQFLGGTGSPLTINGSFNISSITRTNVGRYVVNFTTNLTSNTYAVVSSSSITQSAGIFCVPFYTAAGTISAPTVASFPVIYLGTNGAPFDVDYGNIAVFL
jgi:hypothetical protein